MKDRQSVDWMSQEFLVDPYAHYKMLRESDPVHFDENRGSWLLMRYDDVVTALRTRSASPPSKATRPRCWWRTRPCIHACGRW